MSADGARVCVRVRLQDKVREGISVAQASAETVVVESVDGSRPPRTFRADRWQVTGADVSENHLLVWNSRVAEVHQATPNGFARMSRFDAGRGGSSGALAIWRDAVFRAGRCSVEVCDLAGEVRDTVPLDESHGHVCKMDANGEFLAVTTSGNYLRMWRLGGRVPGARPVGGRSRRRARRARRCDHRVCAGEPRRHARERTLRRAGVLRRAPANRRLRPRRRRVSKL